MVSESLHGNTALKEPWLRPLPLAPLNERDPPVRLKRLVHGLALQLRLRLLLYLRLAPQLLALRLVLLRDLLTGLSIWVSSQHRQLKQDFRAIILEYGSKTNLIIKRSE